MKIKRTQILDLYIDKIYLLEETAKDILGENYNLVYDFFCDVLEIKKEYKILHARRCQVLFKIFFPIILLNESEELDIYGEFISDHAIANYKELLLQNSALIVDDILIHGRGLKKLYETIDKQYTHDRLALYVCRKSRNAVIDSKLQRKIKYSSNAIDLEWRRLSCQFVDLIYSSAAAYISYLGSFYELDKCFKPDDFTSEFDIFEYKDNCRNIQNANAYVLFEKKYIPPIFESLGYDCCLRVYTSKKLSVITYVPYVFIKNLKLRSMQGMIEHVCNAINTRKTAHTIKALQTQSADEDMQIYQMKLFNAFINIVYALHLKKQYNLLVNAIFDLGHLKLCFGEDIAEELSSLTYEDVQNLLTAHKSTWQYSSCNLTEDKELEYVFDKILPNNIQNDNTLSKATNEYFYKNGQIDEQNARLGMERKNGLTLGKFYENIHNAKHLVSLAQLECWDSGIASCNVHIFSNIISSYAAAGEQSFRYILENYKEPIQKMIYAYNCPLWEDTDKSGEELAKAEYEAYLNSHQQDKDIEYFKAFIEENNNTLGEWGIPEILA